MSRAMKGLQFLAVALSAAAAVSGASPAFARAPRAAKAPVVVELFTAQGCTACPQANALLGELAAKPGVIALSFPVDYWDYLGWADTFARPAFTDRQRAYLGRLKLREIYTPEIVVDGRREARGFDRARVSELVAQAQGARRPPLKATVVSKDATGRPARVSLGPGAPAGDVWLVRYDPAERTVKVGSGDNRGKTVVVEHVVRELVKLGVSRGGAKRLRVPDADPALDPSEPALKAVLLVQGSKGGPILAAAAL
jgi:hypothetical protein